MARPLDFKDLNAIRELQPQGLVLDLERARLWPHSPLTAALAAQLPFSEYGASTIVLYQNDRKTRPMGLVQARLRHKRPEADITFIAPAMEAHPDAVSIWYRLLSETVNRLGEQGVQRIYVQVTNQNGEEEVFRQAGFTLYAHEDVYYLAPELLAARQHSKSDATANPRRLRRQRKRDAWYLFRLYHQATPRPVQQAEGMVSSDGRVGQLTDWWDQANGTGYVLEMDDLLAGAARITHGRTANWLRLHMHPQASSYANDLVEEVLELLAPRRLRPLYCGVRDYEGGIRGALEAAGFVWQLKRSLLVKHTTVRVKEPVPWLVPALEAPAPVAPFRTNFSEHDLEKELQIA